MTGAEDIERAAAALRAGQLVGMPTETVYGLAADAGNDEAVAAIFAAKARPRFDPLIVHVCDLAMATTVAAFGPEALALAERFWPGPLTLILPRRAGLSDLVSCGLPTVGVRCPDHDLARRLIRAADLPVAAPSANPFGRISPTTAGHVRDQLGDAVACVLDGGPCRVGVESTVLVLAPEPIVLRPGGLPVEDIAALLGRVPPVAGRRQVAAHLPAEAPGLLASHYAPRVPLRLRAPAEAWPQQPGIGLLAFTGADLPADADAEVLSPVGDATAAAARLFAAMRALEQRCPVGIVAELLPPAGLGLAVNDRLRRAAGLG